MVSFFIANIIQTYRKIHKMVINKEKHVLGVKPISMIDKGHKAEYT